MSPDLALATLKAGFEFGCKLIDYLMTEDGKKFVLQLRTDRDALDKAGKDIVAWFKSLEIK